MGGRIYRLQTSLGVNLDKTSDPLQDSTTERKSLGLNLNLPITQRFWLNFGISPSETRSDEISSTALNSSVGFNAQVFDRLRFMTNFGLNKTEYETEEIETETEVAFQNYGVSYQPFGWLALNTNYVLSDTKDANSTETTNIGVSLSPTNNRFFKQISISSQTTRIEDGEGELRSEGNSSTMNSSFTLIKGMSLSGAFTASTQKNYPLVGDLQKATDNSVNIALSHSVSESLSYGLSYGLSESTAEGDSEDTTTSYSGNVNYGLKVLGRDIPISLGQTLTYSESDTQKVDTRGTNASLQLPITQVVSLSYAYTINQAKTKTDADTTENKTTTDTIGLDLKGKERPFTVNIRFSKIDSEGDRTQSISGLASYPILERLSFKLSYTQNTDTTTSNLCVALNYTF